MASQKERFYKTEEYSKEFEGRIKDLKKEYPDHTYDKLHQLAALLYPTLFDAANGEFEDGFDVKQYTEPERPEFDNAADELAHRAKIYSLRKQVPYGQAAEIIMEVDEDLAERYKMENV